MYSLLYITRKNGLKVCEPGAFGVADVCMGVSRTDLQGKRPRRNWRPPRDDNDYGALAGEHERAALTELGFEMKLCGKDIAVGHGTQGNGFLWKEVFEMWEVENYSAIWGSSGKAVAKACEVNVQGHASKLPTCVGELEQALEESQKDMQKYADMRDCDGTCPTKLKCDACRRRRGRKRWKCEDYKSLNCADCVASADCVAREHHEYMEARVRECKDAMQFLAMPQMQFLAMPQLQKCSHMQGCCWGMAFRTTASLRQTCLECGE